MIKKIIITSIGIFASYNLLLYFLDTNPEYYPSYTSENINKAENYIFSNEDYSSILVGSSLSSKIILKNNYNLSFIGEGPFTGLDIIKKTEKLPNTIIIETNYLVRPNNIKFTESVLSDPMRKLKYLFPAFLEKNQPTFKLANILFTNRNTSTISTNHDRIIEIKKSEYFQLYSEEKIKKATTEFNEAIKYFKNKNTKIIFLTIPIDSSLRNTPRFRQELRMWETLARQNDIPWIKPEGNFHTTDGEHLLYDDNKIFSVILQNKL